MKFCTHLVKILTELFCSVFLATDIPINHLEPVILMQSYVLPFLLTAWE